MLRPVLQDPLIDPRVYPGDVVGWKAGSSYPAALARLWPLKLTPAGVLKCAVGDAPVFTGTPTVDSDGVTPGDGPSFSSVVTWAEGGTRVWEITMSTASVDIVGDVAVGGGLSVSSAGLKFSDGTNTATVATSWDVGDVVTAVVQVDGSETRISDGTTYSAWTNFEGTMPAMAFADAAPGKLKKFEEWKKVTPRPGLLLLDGETITWNGEPLYWEGI